MIYIFLNFLLFLLFLFCLITVGLTWTTEFQESLSSAPEFSLNLCKKKLIFEFESLDQIFPRIQIDFLPADNDKLSKENQPPKQKFADFGILSMPKRKFQTITVPMQFDSLSYDWFTGFSKQVKKIIFVKKKLASNFFFFIFRTKNLVKQ